MVMSFSVKTTTCQEQACGDRRRYSVDIVVICADMGTIPGRCLPMCVDPQLNSLTVCQRGKLKQGMPSGKIEKWVQVFVKSSSCKS